MKVATALKEQAGEKWIPEIYEKKIRVLRTRSYDLGIKPKEHEAEIQHTLLGVELKVGRKRLSCPDLSTARYLRVFARLGVSEVAVPYDISKIAALADELEAAWHHMLLLLEGIATGQNNAAQNRARSAVIKLIRQEINELGAGTARPEFKQSTKQQKYHQKKQ